MGMEIKDEVVFYDENPVRQKLKDGDSYINLKDCKGTSNNPVNLPEVPVANKYPRPLAFIIGFYPLRSYFIKEVKNPLRLALINLAGKMSWWGKLKTTVEIIHLCRKFPKANRKNCFYHNTHVLMDIFDHFFKHYYHKPRLEMFKAVRDALLPTLEYDAHYAWIMNWFAEEIAKEIQTGNWKLNEEPFPQKKCWREEE